MVISASSIRVEEIHNIRFDVNQIKGKMINTLARYQIVRFCLSYMIDSG